MNNSNMGVLEFIKTSKKSFIIAEIGQNHQGDINIAKKLIKIAKKCGADCAKFQKTSLENKFTKCALEKPYKNENSWGETYGDHKKFLEFSCEEFLDLQQYAKEIGILFTASAMDEESLEFLNSLREEVPFIKIGSGDSNNLFLIEKAAKLEIPLIISTGMINLKETEEIYTTVKKYHQNFAFLHCISSYPAPFEDLNLTIIPMFKEKFPNILIGYSGHELGIFLTVSAVALGAKIIERHLTLDKNQKGSDHLCSLEPKEFEEMVRQIRILEISLGEPLKKVQNSEKSCIEKLGKSLVYSKNLNKGHILQKDDLNVKVCGLKTKGLEPQKYREILGKVLKNSAQFDHPVFVDDFQ